MYNVEVLNASLEHIEDILTVEHLSFSVPWSRQSFIDEIQQNKYARYFVAICDGKVVGYAGMWVVCDEGHITNIAVHPDYRKTGIGSKLMEALIKAAEAEGAAELTLEVRKGNFEALVLYQKYGFMTEGVRKGYYSDNNEDALIMWKHRI